MLISTLLTLLLVSAAAASAADYCVADVGCVAAGGTHVGDGSTAVQDALDLAKGTPAADSIVIG